MSHLQTLVAEIQATSPKTPQRRRKLNQLIRTLLSSGQLWRENTPYYNDALQKTWLYVCKNIDRYDPQKSQVTTWVNYYLKRRLQDFQIAQTQERAKQYVLIQDSLADFLSQLPAQPDIPPMLEETQRWVRTDAKQQLRDRHLKYRPDVNCQSLILHRLPPETSWKEIAKRFNLPPSTAPNFYQRECLPCLRQFAQDQGYL